MTTPPSICLNMIVRNEAHIVREVLDCVAPFISYWVIVDTGSTDGTQELIRSYTAELRVPGEIHERPWRNFGANRSEALELARGHCDYIWVIDADDWIAGSLDLTDLTADAYDLRIGQGFTYWRPQILKDGLPWSYRGVVHEYLHCDQPFTRARVEGDYHVQSRRLGNRSADPEKYARDRDLLLAEVERDPDDCRSVFYLAQSYLDYGDPESALKWYSRRAEMGGWAEEVYYSLYRVAECMARLEEAWPVVQDAYLKAWSYRPTRAEPLSAIAVHYLAQREWSLGYLFAERAAQIPMPADVLFVRTDVYTFSALDVQAICAFWLGRQQESFTLCRRLLKLENLEEGHRRRVAANRDFSAPAMLAAAESYPADVVQLLRKGPWDAPITVTTVSGSHRAETERTLNSFLNTCTDVATAGRFVLVDAGMDAADRNWFLHRYPFLELYPAPGTDLAEIRRAVGSRFWLHIPAGWQFFAEENLIGRLTAVLDAEPDIDQVGVNLDDLSAATTEQPPPDAVRSGDGTGRYVLRTTRSTGPAMYDTTRVTESGAALTGTATLDEVLAVRHPESPPTA